MASDAPQDDDDAWLYGDNNPEEQRKEEINAIFDRATEEVIVPGEENIVTTNGDAKEVLETETSEPKGEGEEDKPPENEEEKDSDDDEDSDDDVQVTIGDIKPTTGTYPYGGAPVNLNIKRGGFTAANAAGAGTKTKGIDLETVGLINGVSMYEFNLDTIEDKPWRKPGADITDYFNYGFSEDTWKAYCEKQRKLRLDNNSVPKVVQIIPGKDQQIPIATVNENSKYSGIGVGAKKAGPPPGRRMSGSIDVICGANSSRRSGNAKENVIQVIGRDVYDSSLPPGLPPTHIPPPFIPPNLSVPPPGLPPGMPPTIPPPPGTLPGHVPFPDLYGNPIFSQPPPIVPGHSVDSNSQYDEQYFTGNSSRPFDANSESQHSWANSPHRERDRGRDRDRDRNRDRSRDKDRERYWEERGHERSSSRIPTSEEEYKRRERDEYERRRYREYRERRDKDRHERDYDRDYEREHYERDRGDSRERDRERRHRDRDKDREERHKERSRRRHHHDDDDDHHSSRHKHKKSKREKEEPAEAPAEETESTQPEPSGGGEEEK